MLFPTSSTISKRKFEEGFAPPVSELSQPELMANVDSQDGFNGISPVFSMGTGMMPNLPAYLSGFMKQEEDLDPTTLYNLTNNYQASSTDNNQGARGFLQQIQEQQQQQREYGTALLQDINIDTQSTDENMPNLGNFISAGLSNSDINFYLDGGHASESTEDKS